MSIIKKVINNNKYEFVNSCRGNRSGFVHETQLFKNGQLIGEYKQQYYNRTWESYTYQTVMKAVVRTLLNNEFETFKAIYKRNYDIKRLTKAKEAEMMQSLAENKPENYADLQELYFML